MNFTALGGVGEYGRACFLLEDNKFTIMVDCGVLRTEAETSRRYPMITREIAEKLDAVFLTHSHEDHSAALPYLYHLGYKGKVYATAPTIWQTQYYLHEWQAFEQKKGWVSPHTSTAAKTIEFVRLNEQTVNTWLPLAGLPISFMFGRAGHIAGSAWYVFSNHDQQTVFFSGDYSLESTCTHYDLPLIGRKVDLALMDGAYGIENTPQRELVRNIMDTAEAITARGKKLLIPVPLIGRSLDLFTCHAGRYPGKTIFIDRSLAKHLEAQLQQRFWLKKAVAEKLISTFKESISTNSTSERHKQIFFVLEKEVPHFLERDCSDCYEVLFSGPRHSPLLNLLASRYPAVPVHYKKYHVHPRLSETELLVRHLKPAETIFTHNREEVVQALQEHMRSHHFS
ncbi:RNA processing exonuclease, beta-lactamase fold, Cft2 family [Evansella caseinilytica]|uniref:RNA processing exonuclease, beta-lactamase fold, Cft2 family n=1 Tax=Evansella caseinilytica TaxID=1503961 RepID=A0A1H3U572_9BACI|nr:MBL fold metallo-hydrolase [Evansella caseinilytica]SDZ57437.1 RNA processing exonuclease, beta-lactamase fold, Cft2 family [Evansella caseinilytica]